MKDTKEMVMTYTMVMDDDDNTCIRIDLGLLGLNLSGIAVFISY